MVNPWTVDALRRLGGTPDATLAALEQTHGNSPFGIWATTRGASGATTAKFEKMGRGDVVAFIASGGHVFYAGQVGATLHDLQLGDRLGWERPKTKLPYEHIYTITHGHPVAFDAKAVLRAWLPSNGVVLGFTVKEVPAKALADLQGFTAPAEVEVPHQPDDRPRDERDAAHKIQLRDAGVRPRRTLADDAFSRPHDPAKRRELQERADRSHASVLSRLRDAFETGGATCKEDPAGVDLLVRWPDLMLIVEVKSTWGGFIRPVRHAVAQLYEYRFQLERQRLLHTNHHLVIALDRPPSPRSWLYDYLLRDRGMTLVTQTTLSTFQVQGPHEDALTERVPQFSVGGQLRSGTAARPSHGL